MVLRVKNADGKNYHIEMWKYSKELKQRSENEILGHEHVPDDAESLQNVNIRINSNGMRGEDFPPVKAGQRRIMFLGSSATLGWGIEEEETLSSRIGAAFKKDGRDTVVMNAGIGNYNAKRYVELFLSKNNDLKPTDIVVNYYLNDAEILEAGGGNIFLRNSQLAVTGWILFNRLKAKNQPGSLLNHYKETYEPDYQGFQDMKASLEALSKYARANNIGLYFLIRKCCYLMLPRCNLGRMARGAFCLFKHFCPPFHKNFLHIASGSILPYASCAAARIAPCFLFHSS